MSRFIVRSASTNRTKRIEQFDTPHVCTPCREGFDTREELVEHWNDDDNGRHW